MKSSRLRLYHIDMKYIRDLSKKDHNVMSVSPQLGKESRPFIGIVLICGEHKYCIPLSSPKQKYYSMKNDKDFSKMLDKSGKIIGALNFNNMIPVDDSVLIAVDMKRRPNDSAKVIAYKELLNDELDWCNENREAIIRKANKLYVIVTETPEKMRALTKRCCDFKKLEAVLEKRKNR